MVQSDAEIPTVPDSTIVSLVEAVERQGNLINSYIQEQSRRDERLLSVLETLVARDSSKPQDLWAPQQQQLHPVDSMCHSQPADAPHSETRIRESAPNLRGMPQSRVNHWPQQAVAESRAAPSEEHGSQTSPTKSIDGDSPLATRARSITSQARTSQLLLSFREKEGSHANIDQFFEKEAIMWRMLKATSYWKALKIYLETAAPIPATCFLRMQLQAPQEMSLEELGRVFVEQDSIALMTNVVKPVERGAADMWYLFLFGLIHPRSTFRLRWDMFIMALLLTVCVVTPFVICFDVVYAPLSIIGVWEAVVDSGFMLDIYLNFRTVHIDSNNFLADGWTSAVGYMGGFFLIDVVSTVPWDMLLSSSNDALGLVQLFKVSKLVKFVRIVRIFKLFRIMKLRRVPGLLKILEARIGRVVTRVAGLILGVVFMLHAFACMFHFVAVANGAKLTWIQASGIVNSSSTVDRYVTSMYWAMSTMATVGYGDITPIQIQEKIVSMAGMLAGVTIFAYTTSTVSSLLSTFNQQSARTQERRHQLDSFCRSHKIPRNLSRKLSSFYDHVLTRRIHADDHQMIRELPATLRQQVLLTVHADLFDRIPFFCGRPPQFLAEIMPHLMLEYYDASEYVIWEGDLGTEMYFVSEGILEVRVRVFAKINSGLLHQGMEEEKKMKDKIKKLWKREPQRMKWGPQATATCSQPQPSVWHPLHSPLGIPSSAKPGSSSALSSLYADAVPGGDCQQSQASREAHAHAHGASGASPEHTGHRCPAERGVASSMAVQAVMSLSGAKNDPATAWRVQNLLKAQHSKRTVDDSVSMDQSTHSHADRDGAITTVSSAPGTLAGADGSGSYPPQLATGTSLLLIPSLDLENGARSASIQHAKQDACESRVRDQTTGADSCGSSEPGVSATVLGADGRGCAAEQAPQQVQELSAVDPQEFEDAQESQGGGSVASWSTLQSGNGKEATPGPNWLPPSTEHSKGADGSPRGPVCLSQPGSPALQALLERSQQVAATQALEHEDLAGSLRTDSGLCHVSVADTHRLMQPCHALQQLQQDEPHSIVVSEATNTDEAAAVRLPSSDGQQQQAYASRNVFIGVSRAGPIGESKIAPSPLTIPESPSGQFTGTKITPQESENPFSESMKQWVAPAPPVRFRRAGNSTSWRGMPRRRSTISAPLPSEQKSAEEEEPPEVTTYWHEKNENYHVVERTIGIDSCPHRKLDRLSAGQYFGEMACLTGEKRKASVVTVTACELLSLSRGHLLQAMQAWPSVHAELLKSLSARRA